MKSLRFIVSVSLVCMIVAGLSCMMMPFGTVLGVFTLLVLLKPQVKALFDAPATS